MSVRVLVFRVDQLPKVETLTPDSALAHPGSTAYRDGGHLRAMQAIVGGLIECVEIGEGLDLWCNEDGISLDLPFNLALGPKLPIRGHYFVARATSDGGTASVSAADIAQLTALYDHMRALGFPTSEQVAE